MEYKQTGPIKHLIMINFDVLQNEQNVLQNEQNVLQNEQNVY